VVDVTPKPKMHVYAPEQKDVIPVSLTLDPGEFKAHPAQFPRPQKYFFKPLDETQLVFSTPFRIVQDITVALARGPQARARAARSPSRARSGTRPATMRSVTCRRACR
jgi:hypothetical protein